VGKKIFNDTLPLLRTKIVDNKDVDARFQAPAGKQKRTALFRVVTLNNNPEVRTFQGC
jgi:hypothetical protein